MEIEQLRMFAAVAECGSFTKAAERLYVSHSSTSRAVSSLEAELGVKLLERDNKVIGLTEAGETVLSKARQIIALTDELAESVKNDIRMYSE